MTSKDSACSLQWVPATAADAEALLALMRAFHVEERLSIPEQIVNGTVVQLLANPEYGTAYLLSDGSTSLGYLICTLGFTIEFGGRFVLLDELYLAPQARGRGEGKRALAVVERWAAAQGIDVVRLEVSHHNDKALAIYLGAGYEDVQRRIISKRLRAH